jgi:hypothetical protein
MHDGAVPIFVFFFVFGLPMIAWILARTMRHRERMEMLRLGMIPPPDGRGWRRREHFAAGAVPPQMGYGAYEPDSAQDTLRRGIVTAMVGFAILIGLSFIGYEGGDGPFSPPSIHPGPWLLGGLIPMFVGIAQIVIALMSGASFTLRMQPPPQPGEPPSSGQRSYGSSRPQPQGPRYEELARPIQPPDRT